MCEHEHTWDIADACQEHFLNSPDVFFRCRTHWHYPRLRVFHVAKPRSGQISRVRTEGMLRYLPPPYDVLEPAALWDFSLNILRSHPTTKLWYAYYQSSIIKGRAILRKVLLTSWFIELG